VSASLDGAPGGESGDPLQDFLVLCTSAPPAALLPPPAPCNAGGGGQEPGSLGKRASGRLAAKPSAGLSTMDKVQEASGWPVHCGHRLADGRFIAAIDLRFMEATRYKKPLEAAARCVGVVVSCFPNVSSVVLDLW